VVCVCVCAVPPMRFAFTLPLSRSLCAAPRPQFARFASSSLLSLSLLLCPTFRFFVSASPMASAGPTEEAAFAAGCFWGTQKFFKKQFKDGLIKTTVGYMGGDTKNPTYGDVCTGQTGHAEVLHIVYDPSKVKYEDLAYFFFRFHDPTTWHRQGNDRGSQYRSAIFYYTPEQRQIAEETIKKVSDKFRNRIVTSLEPAGTFYPGEDFHQDYLTKNPDGYCNHGLQW